MTLDSERLIETLNNLNRVEVVESKTGAFSSFEGDARDEMEAVARSTGLSYEETIAMNVIQATAIANRFTSRQQSQQV